MEDNCRDWQISKRKINERTEHLLKSEQWSDCSFIVGSEPKQLLFNAHKMILAMSSPVFEAMFYGGMAEQASPIPILDMQPDAFRALLEYVYKDEVNIKSFDQACEVCYAAKKYMLPHLVEQCTQLVFRDLSPSNACKAYEFAKLFEEPVLMEKSLTIIRNEAEAALADPSFEEVELATVLMILDSETLNISSERDLFNAVHRWALRECARKGLPDDTNGMRSVIGPALKKIHFLTLTPKQYAEGPGLPGLLTQAESYAILMNISSPECQCPLPEGFSTVVEPRPRCRLRHPTLGGDAENGPRESSNRDGHKFFCTRNVGRLISYHNNGHMDCNVSFTVDRNVCIIGIQVPTQTADLPAFLPHTNRQMFQPFPNLGPTPSYSELLYAHLLDSDGSRLTYTHYTSRVDYGKLIEINFNRTVYIQRNKIYKIVVVANKPGTYPLGTEKHALTHCNAAVFNFIDNEPREEPYRDSLVRSIIFSY